MACRVRFLWHSVKKILQRQTDISIKKDKEIYWSNLKIVRQHLKYYGKTLYNKLEYM